MSDGEMANTLREMRFKLGTIRWKVCEVQDDIQKIGLDDELVKSIIEGCDSMYAMAKIVDDVIGRMFERAWKEAKNDRARSQKHGKRSKVTR